MSRYTVVDTATAEICGPFETLRDALRCADGLADYEVIDRAGNVVDWSASKRWRRGAGHAA